MNAAANGPVPSPGRRASGPSAATFRVPTAAGVFTAEFSEKGLCRLEFPKRPASRAKTGPPPPDRRTGWFRQLAEQLDRYFKGEPVRFSVPVDLSGGTEFQRRVWREIARIPAGRTRSYGELAARVGRASAVRAVGGACGANPVPVVIPCHRVVAANGSLGGFSGGLDWKRRLLSLETRRGA